MARDRCEPRLERRSVASLAANDRPFPERLVPSHPYRHELAELLETLAQAVKGFLRKALARLVGVGGDPLYLHRAQRASAHPARHRTVYSRAGLTRFLLGRPRCATSAQALGD